jgi:DNA-binding NtrC family response regulator
MNPDRANILVVDDHAAVVDWLVEELTDRGHAVVGSTRPDEALRLLRGGDFALCVSDLEMPGLRGTELLRILRVERPQVQLILITAFGSVDAAVAAVRAGAWDFLTKPFPIEGLLLSIDRALQHREQQGELRRLRRAAGEPPSNGVVARSAPMQMTLDRAGRVARVDAPVLITGETGVGKGTIAAWIHRHSRRARGPLIQLNCGALPASLIESELFGVRRGAFTDARADRDGLFARAHGGTLFLDEVTELPLEAQPKLLLALESGRVRPVGGADERAVDVRLLAATNRDPAAAVAEGRLREDLLYRLDVVRLAVPPLRDRPDDVEPLVDLLLGQICHRHGRAPIGITTGALDGLRARAWPGNVRELANALERAVVLCDGDLLQTADLDDTPPPADPWRGLDAAAAAGLPLEDVELAYMQRVVDRCGGNLSEAARRLGVDRRTLHRRLGARGPADVS